MAEKKRKREVDNICIYVHTGICIYNFVSDIFYGEKYTTIQLDSVYMTEILLKTSKSPLSGALEHLSSSLSGLSRTLTLAYPWPSTSSAVGPVVSCLLHAIQWSRKLSAGIHSGPACSAWSALLRIPGLSPDCTLGHREVSGTWIIRYLSVLPSCFKALTLALPMALGSFGKSLILSAT